MFGFLLILCSLSLISAADIQCATQVNYLDYYPCVKYIGAWLGVYPNTDCFGMESSGMTQRYQLEHGHTLQNGSFDQQMKTAMSRDIAQQCSYTRITGEQRPMCMKLAQVAIHAPISGHMDDVSQLYVKDYQRQHGLVASGDIDPNTFALIYHDIANSVGFTMYPLGIPVPEPTVDNDNDNNKLQVDNNLKL